MHPSAFRMMSLAILLLAFGGCASKQPYRAQISPAPCVMEGDGGCAQAAVQHHLPNQQDEYYLGFVEFDDQGQAAKREQLATVINTFQTLAGQEQAQDKGVILIAFAHGWHHSASNEPQDDCKEDCNIEKFRELLATTAKMEEKEGTRRKVLGVYIGWRGDSITIPGINNVTFWERKNTAHEVGLQGVTEILVKLEEIANVGNVMQDNPRQKSHLIVLGHSFGGAVVFTALQQILADRYTASQPGKGFSSDAGGFGDLVVLLNPAFEALRYSTLHDISQDISGGKCRNYTESQRPKFIILTSETDQATGILFPMGRSFSTFFETHTDLSRSDCVADPLAANPYKEQTMTIHEGEADRTAVGHYQPFVTHRLNSRPELAQMQRLDRSAFTELKNLWAKQTALSRLPFQGAELEHLGKTHPRNPYLNVRVDKALMDGHNDIWQPAIVNFVRDFIITTTLVP